LESFYNFKEKKEAFLQNLKIFLRALPWRLEAGGEQSRVRRPQRAGQREGGGSGRSSPASPIPGSRIPPRRCTSACGNSAQIRLSGMYCTSSQQNQAKGGGSGRSSPASPTPGSRTPPGRCTSACGNFAQIRLSGTYKHLAKSDYR
jgi:hypothetical protein